MELFNGFPHVLESQQFSLADLEALFQLADRIRTHPHQFYNTLAGQQVAVLFNQPSSRTRASFQLAATRLGANVYAESHMAQFSSIAKGESLEDTIRMFLEFGIDQFIIRWHEEGSVARAAAVAGDQHPVINAGDGPGQHPTQALLDVYTIWRDFGVFTDRLLVGVVGDLTHGRTVHSLVYLLAKYPDTSFVFIAPPESPMKPELLDHLREHHRQFEVCDSGLSPTTVQHLDVLYMTRPQLEYKRSDAEREVYRQKYKPYYLTPELAAAMMPDSIIMHPLPRNEELPVSIDANPRSRYFQQMANGLWIRMALLATI